LEAEKIMARVIGTINSLWPLRSVSIIRAATFISFSLGGS